MKHLLPVPDLDLGVDEDDWLAEHEDEMRKELIMLYEDEDSDVAEALEQWRDDIKEIMRDNVDVMEWWSLNNTWIETRLQNAGEIVLINDAGNSWWGRQCTGQALCLDHIFWVIFQKEIERVKYAPPLQVLQAIAQILREDHNAETLVSEIRTKLPQDYFQHHATF
jgi:hypothetical protein